MAEIFSRSALSGRRAFGRDSNRYPGGLARPHSEHDDSGRTDSQVGDRESARPAQLLLLSASALSPESNSIYTLVTSVDGLCVGALNRRQKAKGKRKNRGELR